MMEENILHLFVCPKCKGYLDIETESLQKNDLGLINAKFTCSKCKKEYFLRDGIFYFDTEAEYEKEPNIPWDKKVFEKAYKRLGYYESTKEYAKRVGTPGIVIDYDYPKVKGRLLEWLNPSNHCIILDIGCGVGYFMFEMFDKYPEISMVVIGMDVSESNLHHLLYRKRKEKKSEVYGVVANAENLPFRESVFDLVTCTEVLEHVFKPENAIKEMSRVIKGNGRLLISTPSFEGMKFWDIIMGGLIIFKRFLKMGNFFVKVQNLQSPYGGITSPPYDSPISKEDLKECLQSQGFKIIDMEFNVIIPPQSYFKYLPMPFVEFILNFCSFIERSKYLKRILRRLALHVLIQCIKTKE